MNHFIRKGKTLVGGRSLFMLSKLVIKSVNVAIPAPTPRIIKMLCDVRYCRYCEHVLPDF